MGGWGCLVCQPILEDEQTGGEETKQKDSTRTRQPVPEKPAPFGISGPAVKTTMSITLTPDGKHLCLHKHLHNVYQTAQETLCLAALTPECAARERLKGYKYLCENLGSLTVPWRLKS